MPTVAGLPRKGDRLQHVESGIVVRVVVRNGNDWLCNVIVQREDHRSALNTHHAYGYPRDHMRLLSVMWLLKHNIYRYVKEEV